MYTLYYNGTIHSLNQNNSVDSLLLTQKNRIVYCGNEQDLNLPEYQVKKVDLKRLSVLPAFIDCHTHLVLSSQKYNHISISHSMSFKEMLNEVKSKLNRFGKGEWIKGSGWNANIWNDKIPHKKYLDEISAEHPIALFSKDLHTLWLNSIALKTCQISSNIPSKYQGKIQLDKNGEPTGLLVEDACHLVDDFSSELNPDQSEKNLTKFSNELLAKGITSVHTMEGSDELALLERMSLNKKLHTRVCFHPPEEEVETLVKAKIYTGFGNEWLRFGGLKYFVDGSLGSQTAEMFENYLELNHSGIEILNEAELTNKISYAAANGLSATIHAIGNRANHKTLNALSKIFHKKQSIPLRHKIEHSQIINNEDIPRFKKMNIIASMQPLHIADDVRIGDRYLGKRAAIAYPIKTLLDAGTKIVFGSDTPVADFDPFKGMLAAICRRYNLDKNEPSWFPDQKIKIQQAVNAYTKEAAYSSYEEHLKGTLEPGKLADFVVLSEDILKVSDIESSLRNVKVMATIMDGEIVYRDEDF